MRPRADLTAHVVGAGWPAVATRHEMLREALGIIRLLWSGEYHSYDGKHLRLEDTRVFDLPDDPPEIAVAVGGTSAVQIAA
ncbi:LLM class flavin-dependent oxidoreductase [Kribbella sp. NPDC050469]|uniref:LLM class flavin-dependent oxidoreductase n=1 Tax=Kribbella sp. NPDC050469 TaxID=3364116 RepID=UPI003793DD07